MNPVRATLDACVLHPMAICDSLLIAAELTGYHPVWSTEILDELERSLVRRFGHSDAARRRIDTMQSAFPGALSSFRRHHLARTGARTHQGDAHVAALALATKSSFLVTLNLRHFDANELGTSDVRVATPDAFLVDLFRDARLEAERLLRIQWHGIRHDRPDWETFVARLQRALPEFVRAAREGGPRGG